MKLFAIILTVFFMAACVTTGHLLSKAPKRSEVKKNKVYADGVLYAELILAYPSNNRCRGLAIHYVPTDSYSWISPQGGLQLKDRQSGKIIEDIPSVAKLWDRFYPPYIILKNFNPVAGDGYFKMDWRFDIQFSEDGRVVTYNEQTESGIIGGTKKTYRVLY